MRRSGILYHVYGKHVQTPSCITRVNNDISFEMLTVSPYLSSAFGRSLLRYGFFIRVIPTLCFVIVLADSH